MKLFSSDNEEYDFTLAKAYQEIAEEHNNLLKFLANCYPEVLKEWKGGKN